MKNLTFQTGECGSIALTNPTSEELITRLWPEGTSLHLEDGGTRALRLITAQATLTLQWEPDLSCLHVMRESGIASMWEGPYTEAQALAWLETQTRDQPVWKPRRMMELI